MQRFRKVLIAASVAFALSPVVYGQNEKQTRRLESVTWNPSAHKLSWTVAQGKVENGKFVEKEKFNYEIDMDAATMSAEGQDRRFSKQEAVSVHALMDLVAKYAAESTLWWDAGQGEPLDEDAKSKARRDNQERRGRDYLPDSPRRPDPRSGKTVRISFEQ